MAALFKPHVEAVIHDLGCNQIAYIANAFSKRRVGDSSAGYRFDEAVLERDVIGPYLKAIRGADENGVRDSLSALATSRQ